MSRLYTQKYVNVIKQDNGNNTAKFLKMATHMVEKIQRETIARARLMVMETQKKFTEEFDVEANIMIE